MKVKCEVLVNELDKSIKVYVIPGMDTKFVDNVEFVPVFEDPKKPKLLWVRKGAYQKNGWEVVDING